MKIKINKTEMRRNAKREHISRPFTVTPESVYLVLNSLVDVNVTDVERMLMFVSVLYRNSLISKIARTRSTFDRSFFNLNRDTIFNILSRRETRRYLNILQSEGIIMINNSYSAGNFTKSYRISDDFLEGNAVKRYITKKTCISAARSFFIKSNSVLINKYDFVKHLSKIYLDDDASNEWLKNNEVDFTTNQFNYYVSYTELFNERDYETPTLSQSNSRLYTTLTNLPSKLRQFLYTIDEETGEVIYDKTQIDASNSQVFLLAVMLKDKYHLDSNFIKHAFDGTIYEHLTKKTNEYLKSIDYFGIDVNDMLKVTRTDVKRWFVENFLFTKNSGERIGRVKTMDRSENAERVVKNAITGVFKSEFHDTFNAVKFYKSELVNEYKTTPDGFCIIKSNNIAGSLFACELQRLEANLWLDNISFMVPSEVKFFTVHDSIVLFNASDDVVSSIVEEIKSYTKKKFGISIPIKINKI